MLGRRIVRRVSDVYNLVLTDEHVVRIGGVSCVTLAHGLTGPVVGHPFYGTDKVLEALAEHPGWASGRIALDAPLGV